MPPHPAIVPGQLAVISGGASGIGLAAAKALAGRHGMHVVIGDIEGVDQAAKQVQSDAKQGVKVTGLPLDVTSSQSITNFAQKVNDEFKDTPLTVLMANAGISGSSKASEWQGWERVLAVNMYGVINFVQHFLPIIKQHSQPSLIINTGSKQGITTPPATGPAYNVSKSGVKIFTEQLAWELRNDETVRHIEPKLLIPGWVWTGLTGAKDKSKTKPDGAWTAEQTVDFLFKRLEKPEVFYILCPDNETPRETDLKRMEWNIGDIIEDRPALSRWHEKYADQFAAFAQKK